MEEFTNQERSLFLRFVWGRTRLPRTIADFRGRDFVIQILDKYTPPDHFLPESYTCFFLLKMPRYSCKVSENFILLSSKITNGCSEEQILRNKIENETKNEMWKHVFVDINIENMPILILFECLYCFLRRCTKSSSNVPG